jgi:cystathionine beta-lyase/cystathionine gamma-synthase
VARVYYPGLASHPDHEIARSQMSGFGGMVTFEVPGGLEGASRVFDRFQVIRRATSLGCVNSLASLPVLTSHYNYSDEDLRRAGVTAGMLRISIGLEDEADLIADIDQALG